MDTETVVTESGMDSFVVMLLQTGFEQYAALTWVLIAGCVIGGILFFLQTFRATIQALTLSTKTKTDDKIYNAVYSIMDKFPKMVLFFINIFKSKTIKKK